MTCAAGKMVCANRQNGLRSWQNGLRAISDVTDVLGKMICALVCAWFALGLRAGGWGACSAAQTILILAKCTYTSAADRRWGHPVGCRERRKGQAKERASRDQQNAGDVKTGPVLVTKN